MMVNEIVKFSSHLIYHLISSLSSHLSHLTPSHLTLKASNNKIDPSLLPTNNHFPSDENSNEEMVVVDCETDFDEEMVVVDDEMVEV